MFRCPSRSLSWTLAALLSLAAACGGIPAGDDSTTEQDLGVFGYTEPGYQALGILAAANQLDATTLNSEVGLTAPTTANLVAARSYGNFTDLAGLKAVGGMGQASFKKLLTYATAHGLLPSCGDGVVQPQIEDCDGTADCSSTCKYLTGGWTAFNSNTNGGLNAIWGTASNDVWAAGRDIVRWNGSAWKTVGSYVNAESVWGSGADDVWFIVNYTSFLHWDGSALTAFSATGLSETGYLDALWGSGPNDVWAAGGDEQIGHGVLLHWDGTSWSSPAGQLDNSVRIYALSGTSSKDVWAAGLQGYLQHWNGTSWEIFASGTTNALETLSCGSKTDCWAGGEMGTALHWNGSEWSSTQSRFADNIFSIRETKSGDVWAVGYPGYGSQQIPAMHWTGSAWSEADGQESEQTWLGVWSSSATDVWAVGAGGEIYHYR